LRDKERERDAKSEEELEVSGRREVMREGIC
jgi:hypothetical protein